MFKNDPSPENEYVLAGISYFPLVGFIIILTSLRKLQYIKYHAGHSIILYTMSLFFLFAYILVYILLRSIITDSFYIDILWGLIFSLHLLSNFIYLFYCSIQAYQGRYLIIPFVTKLYYLIFNR